MPTILLLSNSAAADRDLKPYIGFDWPDLRIAHIITASKGKGCDDLSYLDRTREIFRQRGAYFEDIDLSDYEEAGLELVLKRFNAVFVSGGSSFYLLKAMRERGFAKLTPNLLAGGLIYIGVSAGAYVACPSIEMALWRHQDKYDHCGLSDLSALGLVPFLVTVHYRQEYQGLVREGIKRSAYPVRILTDGQAIAIRDGREEFLGGKEIKL